MQKFTRTTNLLPFKPVYFACLSLLKAIPLPLFNDDATILNPSYPIRLQPQLTSRDTNFKEYEFTAFLYSRP